MKILYVGGIPFDAPQASFMEFVEHKVGPIAEIAWITNRMDGKFRGFAFLYEFQDLQRRLGLVKRIPPCLLSAPQFLLQLRLYVKFFILPFYCRFKFIMFGMKKTSRRIAFVNSSVKARLFIFRDG